LILLEPATNPHLLRWILLDLCHHPHSRSPPPRLCHLFKRLVVAYKIEVFTVVAVVIIVIVIFLIIVIGWLVVV
jgi:hypothetical protein